MVTFPLLRMPKDSIAVLSRLRSSCARAPMRSVPRSTSVCSRSRSYSVTAWAMASSRPAVQGVKLVDGDFRVELECELGHRLTDVTVVVNDLAHREPHAKHVVAVLGCARIHFVAADSGATKW